MRINKGSLIAALALGGLVACSTLAVAQDAKEGGNKGGKKGPPSVDQMMERYTDTLKLTDEQKPKVKAVLEDTARKRQDLRDLPQDERQEKGRALRDEQNKKMKDILTPEQYTKYEQMPRPGRGGPGGPPPAEKKEEKKD